MYIECRHIFPSGKKCKSPALTDKDFCYFHHNKRNQKTPARKSGEPSTLIHHLPQLEDEDTILTAISDVIQALGANRIDPRRAQILLYGLQVASQHSKRLSPHTTVEPVRQAYEDIDGTLLGPRQQAWDTEDITLNEEEEDEEDREITEEDRRAYFGIRASAQPEEEDHKPRQFHLPYIQAVADSGNCRETSVRRTSAHRLPGQEKSCPILCETGVPGTRGVRALGREAKGEKQESAPKRTAPKPRRIFPQGIEAPLLPPDPPLQASQFRACARKHIIKTLLGDSAQRIANPRQVAAGQGFSQQGTATPIRSYHSRNRTQESNRSKAVIL